MPRGNFMTCTCAIFIMAMALGCSGTPLGGETGAPSETRTLNSETDGGPEDVADIEGETTVVGVVLEANRPLGFRMEISKGGHDELNQSSTDVVITEDTESECQSGGEFALESGMEVEVTYDLLLDSDPPKIPAVSVTADC